MKQKHDTITKDSTVKKVLSCPKGAEILAKHNFPCLHCPMAAMEIETLTIGQVCEMYGLDTEKLLKDLHEG